MILENDFYIVELLSETLECYLTDSGLQSLDGSGRVFEVEKCLSIKKMDINNTDNNQLNDTKQAFCIK